MINVLEGPDAAIANPTAVAGEGGTTKMKIDASEQFKFIKLGTELKPMKRDDFFGSGMFYGLLALPLVCIPLLMAIRKKKQAIDSDVAGNRRRQSDRLVRKYLSEAKNNLSNKEQFYISLERAMHNFLKAKLHIETSEMSKEKIREILLTRNAGNATVSDFIVLAESCEMARYAPSSAAAIQYDYEKAVSVLSDLEKQLA